MILFFRILIKRQFIDHSPRTAEIASVCTDPISDRALFLNRQNIPGAVVNIFLTTV